MNFRESTDYLLSLGNEVETMKLGLENIRKLLAALGDPQNNCLKVQVAGTNGKGSVCAFLDSICLQAGIKAGVFMSPHLVSITERVRIGGVDISEDEFARIATRVRETSEQLVSRGELETVPTYFEQVTAIALVTFAESKVDLAILETGLGGRFDAVTAANAEICAITRIDLDHQQYLGETIEEIAAEKAAIIRSDSKVVIGEQNEVAMNVILERCRELGIIPQVASKMYVWQLDFWTGKPTVSEFEVDPPSELGVTPGLAGRHQIENAYTAIMLSGTLANDFNLEISEDQIGRGVERARHPGRLEWIGRFLLDGAHNVGGAQALRRYLDEYVDRPVTIVFGAMKDKNVAEIARVAVPEGSENSSNTACEFEGNDRRRTCRSDPVRGH
jgi:dihydrofolate synthase/folylpolyglutamate synthase